MKKLALTIVLLLGLSLAAAPNAEAAQVTAALPDFAVHLNGEEADNAYAEYPLLRYRDVTYFPMTWYNCRMLGLTSQWQEGKGLVIEQNDAMASSMGYYLRNEANPQALQAKVAEFAITVNGQAIDNAHEPYPLLVFRDVTYFPLTWRFAHDAFGWEYTYTDQEGLSITSRNPQIQYMPVLHGRTRGTPIRLLDKGYYYYVCQGYDYASAAETSDYWYGTKDRKNWEADPDVVGVVRAPWDNSAHAQLIYTFMEPPASVDFAMLDNEPYVIYQPKTGEALKALAVGADGTCTSADVPLTGLVNGSSTGNKLGQWTFGIRDKYLSRTQNGIDWEVYSAVTASWYGLLGQQVFCLHPVDGQNGCLYLASGTTTDKKLAEEKVRAATICDGYVVCLLEASEDYGAKIFAPDGTLKLAVTGPVDLLSISDGTVLTLNKVPDDDHLKLIHLP